MLTFIIGNGGWIRFDATDWNGPVYARFVERSGRLVVSELYIDTRGGTIRGMDLRQLDLSQLEALATEGIEEFRVRSRYPGPDLGRLASHIRTGFGRQAKHWVADSMRAQIKGSDVRQAPPGREPKLAELEPPDFVPLARPEHGLTDEFLREVAAAYARAVRVGEFPAPMLAAESGADRRTVQSWIVKARRRGIMSSGSQGKVG